MGQKPNRTPVNIPILTKVGNLKWAVNSPTPKWDPIGFDPQPYHRAFVWTGIFGDGVKSANMRHCSGRVSGFATSAIMPHDVSGCFVHSAM